MLGGNRCSGNSNADKGDDGRGSWGVATGCCRCRGRHGLHGEGASEQRWEETRMPGWGRGLKKTQSPVVGILGGRAGGTLGHCGERPGQ